MRRARLSWLKTLLGLVLLAVLLIRLENRGLLVEAIFRALSRPWPLAIAAGLFGLCLTAGFLRWRELLLALGLRISLSRGFYLYALGHAGNIFLPSGFGGDFVKAAALSRDRSVNRGLAIFSLMADRLIGLFWLMVLGFAVSLSHGLFFSCRAPLRILAAANAAALALALALAILLSRRHASGREKAGETATRRGRLANLAALLLDTSGLLARHPRTVALTGIYSLLNHVGQAACAWILVTAIGAHLPVQDMLAVFVPANLLTAVPLTPGGLGVREIALPWMLAPYGIGYADGMAVSLLFYGVMLAWGIICSLPWLVSSRSP